MNYPLQSLIDFGVLPAVVFPTDSRYCGSSTLQYSTAGGDTVTYLARRFVPAAGAPNFATVARHTLQKGDRLDLIAAKYLGDPLFYWLLCDANGALDPDTLVDAPGTVLNITLPQGIPGGSLA